MSERPGTTAKHTGPVARYAKAAPPKLDHIPPELTIPCRWLAWRFSERASPSGKFGKVPYGITGKKVDYTDPHQWLSFEIALQLYQSGDYHGIGIALGGGLVGVDWDDCCADDGTCDAEVLDQVRQLSTYTERSVSGTGLHALAAGALPVGPRKRQRFEMYSERRFFVVTGDRIAGAPESICLRDEELRHLHSSMFEPKPRASQIAPLCRDREEALDSVTQFGSITQRGGGERGNKNEKRSWFVGVGIEAHDLESRRLKSSPRSATWDDAVVLKRLLADPVALKYWHGFPDGVNPSDADFALAAKLAFYTGKDLPQMERLFRRSGLYIRRKDVSPRGDIDYVTYTLRRAAGRVNASWRQSTKKAQKRGRPLSEVSRQVIEMDQRQPNLTAHVVAAYCGVKPSYVRVIRHRARARAILTSTACSEPSFETPGSR